jgi:polyisoprenoid-binding protein YceI
MIRQAVMRSSCHGVAVALCCASLAGACGSEPADAPRPSTAASSVGETSTVPLTGLHQFTIVPERSKASYHAREEFFPGALRRLGIEPGTANVVGSTQAIEGHFRFDPDHLSGPAEENAFTVRLTTLQSNEQRRDDYIREIRDDGGPSFDAYPVARFVATTLGGSSTPGSSGRDLKLKLGGDLTVRDVTKNVVFDVEARLVGSTLTGTATTQVLLSQFGIGPIDFYDTLKVADDIGLAIEFTARAD